MHSITYSSTHRRQVRSPHISYPVASHGTDLPNKTSIQRCGRTHRGGNIRVLCSSHAHLLHGSANLSQRPSGISASLLDSPDDHGHPALDHDDPGQGTNTPPPCPFQISVCPQSRPNPTPKTAVVRVTQSCTATSPVAVIPPDSLDAENAFSEGKESPLHSSWTRSSETPAQVHNTNTAADLSPCNGTPAILDKHDACPDRDDNEGTRPVTTPSVRTSQPLRQHFVPLDIAHGTYDASLTYISDDVVLFWEPPSVSSNGHPHHLRWASSITLAHNSS